MAPAAMAPGAVGMMTITWPGAGYYWQFTVDSTDSLSAPNWQPVAPASQWPNFSTSYTVPSQPGMPQQFYRVRASPYSTP